MPDATVALRLACGDRPSECAQPPQTYQHSREKSPSVSCLPTGVLPTAALSCVPVLCPSRAMGAARTPRSPPRGSCPSSLGPRQSLCLLGLSNHVGGAPRLPAGFMSTQLFSPKPQWCPRHTSGARPRSLRLCLLMGPPTITAVVTATHTLPLVTHHLGSHGGGAGRRGPKPLRTPLHSTTTHSAYPRPRHQATCLSGLHTWSQVGMVSGQVFPSACPQSL